MPRSPERSDLPDNLYQNKTGYFYWRDPNTRKSYGLGRDRDKAIEQAKKANAFADQHKPGLVARIQVPTDKTLGQFLPTYREHVKTLGLATRTQYAVKACLKSIEKHLSDVPIGTRYEDAPAITARCYDFLKAEYLNAGKLRMAKVVRSTLHDLLSCMISRGWLAVNPVRDLDLPAPQVKRQRLTLETFWPVYNAAEDEWLKRGMELALVTLQRREDVANMGFRDVQNGVLLVEQGKTDTRLRIPLALTLKATGWNLGEVIKSCRDLVVSPHLIHHDTHQGKAKPGMRVHPQTLSNAFTAARIRSGIAVDEGKTPPTFHELRSLGIRLYEQQGYNPQALAGHKQASTTALYRDDRGAEWIEVNAK